MGISVKVLQYLPQGFDFLLGWTFFPPDQKKRVKFLRKGNFSTRRHTMYQEGALKHAAACSEGYFKHTGQYILQEH